MPETNSWQQKLKFEFTLPTRIVLGKAGLMRIPNENTNGLLRQYLPKGSDLNSFSQKELDAIAWKLNTRGRKSLGFKCPAQLFTPDAFYLGGITLRLLRFVLETAFPILKPQLNAVLCR